MEEETTLIKLNDEKEMEETLLNLNNDEMKRKWKKKQL